MEMAAFRRVLGPAPVPVFSVKGGIGHTMGAAGLVETTLALRCVAERRIPPTVGCLHVAEPASGWVSTLPQDIGAGPVLATNSGFGGINTALVLAPQSTALAGAAPAP
jgi:3-oxoacyl-[acyl-carrier-protein] synthase II